MTRGAGDKRDIGFGTAPASTAYVKTARHFHVGVLLDAAVGVKTTIKIAFVRAGGRRGICWIAPGQKRHHLVSVRPVNQEVSNPSRIYNTTGSMTSRPLNDRRQRTDHDAIRARRPKAAAAIILLTHVHDPRRQGVCFELGVKVLIHVLQARMEKASL
jgi:hypothetical protein